MCPEDDNNISPSLSHEPCSRVDSKFTHQHMDTKKMSTSHKVTTIIWSTSSIPQEIIQVELFGSELYYLDLNRAVNMVFTCDEALHKQRLIIRTPALSVAKTDSYLLLSCSFF